MDPLVQRIRDLDQITFQQLCFQVMSERFPGAKIRYPEGAAGDEGIDFFLGDLAIGPTVWQCKAFQVTVVGDSQKQQIKDSLREAVNNVDPRIWILCLNINFDMKAVRWFRRLQESHKTRGLLVADPFEGLDVARHLMFQRSLRRHYFPQLQLDPSEIKSVMKACARGLDSVDIATLERLTTEDTEEWLDRLQEKDARFVYEVTFGGDHGPNVFPPIPERGLMSARTDGRKIIKAYARDIEALRLDPVSSQIGFVKGAEKKLLDFMRTGREQHWGPDEIVAFRSSVPLFSDMKFVPGTLSISLTQLPDNSVIPLKLTFRRAEETASIDFLEFRRVRVGTEEIELSTIGKQSFGMTLVLPTDSQKSATSTVSTHWPGKSIRSVAKACTALRLLQKGCEIELFSPKLDAKLCVLESKPLAMAFKDALFTFIEDLAAISVKFDVNFDLPEASGFSAEDEKTFRLLRALTRNEPLELANFRISLVKSSENAAVVPQQFRNEMVFRMEHESATATLFGVEIPLGPTAIEIDRAEIEDLPETLERFLRANIGSVVSVSLRPLTPVRFLSVNRSSLLSSRQQ